MLAGFPPFYDENPIGIYQKILAGRVEPPASVSSAAASLVLQYHKL
jgi:hypothetical protein